MKKILCLIGLSFLFVGCVKAQMVVLKPDLNQAQCKYSATQQKIFIEVIDERLEREVGYRGWSMKTGKITNEQDLAVLLLENLKKCFEKCGYSVTTDKSLPDVLAALNEALLKTEVTP